jgi:hypothetical protein
MRWVKMAIVACIAVGCAGSDKSAEAPDDAAAPDTVDTESGGASDASGDGGDGASAKKNGLPNECVKRDGDVCLPPNKFVAQLCGYNYPTVAVAMFGQGTPWTRAYVTHETEAVNASGGGSSGDMLKIDEEVLVLRHRGPSQPGGIQVSGADGSYDVLRWDGGCVTLHPSELRFDPPNGAPRTARIVWGEIEYDIREKLKENETIYQTYVKHKRACKGQSFGQVSKKCVDADEELGLVIAEYIRSNGIPAPPKKLPD